MKLVSLNHDQSSRVYRIISLIVSLINIIIDNDHRPVIVAKRTPGNIIGIIIPVNPGRSPANCGNPVPAKAEPPVPPPVMVNGPAPGFSRNPGPANTWIPGPTPDQIWTPVNNGYCWHPNITIRPLINPAAIGLKFRFIFPDFSW